MDMPFGRPPDSPAGGRAGARVRGAGGGQGQAPGAAGGPGGQAGQYRLLGACLISDGCRAQI